MELRGYLRTVRRGWLWIVLATVLGGAVAYGVTTRITPSYVSTSSVFISTSPRDAAAAAAGAEFSQQRVASYVDVVSGLELSQRVVDTLGLDESAEELATQIEATAVPETVVLRIDVTDTDPEQAQTINEAVLTVLGEFVTQLETPRGGDTPLLTANVIDTPNLPDEAASPQPLLNVGFGVLIGLLLGIGLAVARELLDTRVRSLDAVPALADVPLLATLPYDKDVEKTPLVTDLSRQASRAEAFRVLATNLSFVQVDADSKVLVVTSGSSGEGKTTVAVNAAAAMAAAGLKTVLVDADLRRPQVAELLGLEKAVGLSTVLAKRSTTLEQCLQRHAGTGLHVLTSGRIPPNPFELLQSKQMAHLLDQLREDFEVVVLDAPPLLPVADGAVLSALSDGAVLVVRQGRTTRDQVARAVQRLHAVGSRPVGSVLNMVRKGSEGAGSAYGYGYAAEDADQSAR